MGSIWSSQDENSSSIVPQRVVSMSENWIYSREAGGWIALNDSQLPADPHSHDSSRLSSLVDIKSTKLVKSPASLHKRSLVLIQKSQFNHLFCLHFTFDSNIAIQIIVHLDAQEDTNDGNGHDNVSKFYSNVQGWPNITNYPAGMNQLYQSNALIDTTVFGPKEWEQSLKSNRFPIVIELLTENEGIRHSQISYLALRGERDAAVVSVLRQSIVYGERVFELEEIYGLDAYHGGDSTQNGTSASVEEQSKECVICLTESRTTAVLPCRHLCLCSNCAAVLRIQNNKCPVCRSRKPFGFSGRCFIFHCH